MKGARGADMPEYVMEREIPNARSSVQSVMGRTTAEG